MPMIFYHISLYFCLLSNWYIIWNSLTFHCHSFVSSISTSYFIQIVKHKIFNDIHLGLVCYYIGIYLNFYGFNLMTWSSSKYLWYMVSYKTWCMFIKIFSWYVFCSLKCLVTKILQFKHAFIMTCSSSLQFLVSESSFHPGY